MSTIEQRPTTGAELPSDQLPVVSVHGLRKEYFYGKYPVPALNGTTFDVHRGQFLGLFGPNGAGKTTTIKIIVGLVRPQEGTVLVGGHDATQGYTARRLIGYVPQQGSLLGSLTVREELTFHGRSFGLSKRRAAARAEDVATTLEVGDLLARDVQRLSGGQRRRVEIALALVHEPQVLVLDEPTLGLDPQTRAGLWDTITDLRRELGTTIVMSTHYLDEASSLMDRIVIMDHGVVVADGTPEDIVEQHATGTVRLGPFDEVGAALDLVLAALPDAEPGPGAVADGPWVEVRTVEPASATPRLISALEQGGIRVYQASATPPTVSDAFFAITGRRLAS